MRFHHHGTQFSPCGNLDIVNTTPAPSEPTAKHPWVLMFVAVCLVSVNLRMSITGVGPLIEEIGDDLGLTAGVLGLLGSMPLIIWGLFSPLAHTAAKRFGTDRSITWALVFIGLGTVLRSVPGLEANLWVGTVLIGIGLAIPNVLIPSVVRRDFGTRIPLVMGIYTAILGGFGSVSSAMVQPISNIVVNGNELGWRIALLSTGISLPIAIVVWVVATSKRAKRLAREGHPEHELRSETGPEPETKSLHESGGGSATIDASNPIEGTSHTTSSRPGKSRRLTVWRDPVAWWLACFMGLQSLVFYTASTWIAPIEESFGASEVGAGLSVSVFQVTGILGSLALPLMYRGGAKRWLAGVLPAITVLGVALVIWQIGPSLVWLAIGGFFAGTTLSLQLMFTATRVREHETASALSGMAQMIGYLVAATGPIIFGSIHELSGDWTTPLWFLWAVLLVQTIAGFMIGRDRYVFDAARGR